MRVDILTARNGGPLQWGKGLTSVLNRSQIKAKHTQSYIRWWGADIIHSTVPVPIRWKPMIVTVQGDYTLELNVWRRFYPGTIRRADIVTTPSQRLKQKLGLEDAVVIPNAVFPEGFTPVKHEHKDKLNLITVANFYFPSKAKGLLNIVDILSRIQSHRFEYTVVGAGTYLEAIQQQAVRSKVRTCFMGFLPDPRTELAISDIFLYYSHLDVFPVAILEAMASGLPVVTNNVGAVSEMIDNGKDGYVAENDEDYLSYLRLLLGSHRLRQEIGRRARAKVEEKFSWHEVAKQFVQLYGVLL